MTISHITDGEDVSDAVASINAAIDRVNGITATLSSAELRAASVTPVTIIPAQGAGTMIVPRIVAAKYNFGTAYYDAQAGVDQLKLGANTWMANFITTLVLGKEVSAYGFSQDGALLFVENFSGVTDLHDQPLTFTTQQSWGDTGLITASHVQDGGTGYLVGDTFFIDPDEVAIGTVDTVDGMGAVLTYTITTPGSSQVGVQTTVNDTGVGVGLTIDVTAIALGDGTVDLTVWYEVFSG